MDNVLIIAPHIDDEVLGVGGSISKHIAAGDKVTVVAVTDRLEFKDKQREEAIQVSKYFDLEDYFFLGLKDMYLDVCMKDIIDPLEHIYKYVAPSIVYGPYSGDINIDHQSVHRATTVVCRTHQEHGLDKFLLYEIPSSTEQGVVDNFKPNYFNVLSKKNLEDKLASFEYYEDEHRPLPNPRNADGISVYAQFRGMQCATEYAEAFINVRQVNK
jgi:LmbE family N-acetylglucosaminyl deacetylase|tara:strand:+ start:550 stop:1191 length:642 start_codon:yes stop_codon:yes gene_type:complete